MLLGHGPRVGKHARAKTWGADLFGGGGGGVPAAEPKQFSTPTKPRRGRALTAPEGAHKRKHILEKLVTRDPVASTLAERAPRPFPLTIRDDADAERDEKHHSRSSTTRAAESRESSRATANGVFRGDGRDRDAAIRLSANAPRSPKVVVVHHLKVNDVALRVSYDGPPKKFHEVRLLLDASTHAAFVGRWRELIDRVKKKIVWSVLKSVTGLQGRRLPGTAGSAGTGSAGTGSAGTGSAGTGSDVAAGEASARRGFGAFGNMAKAIKVRFGEGGGATQATLGGSDGNILRVPEGFEVRGRLGFRGGAHRARVPHGGGDGGGERRARRAGGARQRGGRVRLGPRLRRRAGRVRSRKYTFGRRCVVMSRSIATLSIQNALVMHDKTRSWGRDPHTLRTARAPQLARMYYERHRRFFPAAVARDRRVFAASCALTFHRKT